MNIDTVGLKEVFAPIAIVWISQWLYIFMVQPVFICAWLSPPLAETLAVKIQPIRKGGAKTSQFDENGSAGPAKYSF